jgi:hypothetical protein
VTNLWWIDPGDDSNIGEEQREDKVHGDHSSKSVVVGIRIVGEDVEFGHD